MNPLSPIQFPTFDDDQTSEMHLVLGASLPETSPLDGGAVGIAALIYFGSIVASAVHPSAEAGEQDNESGKEEENQGGKNCPDTRTIFGVRSGTVVIDMVFNDGEESKITGKGYNHDDEGDGRCDSCEDGTTDTSAKSKEESNEGKSSGNWVENHDTGESL